MDYKNRKGGSDMKETYMMTADEIADELGVSKGKAYKVIRDLNAELEQMGFIVISGKIPRAYWEKKFFGYNSAVVSA